MTGRCVRAPSRNVGDPSLQLVTYTLLECNQPSHLTNTIIICQHHLPRLLINTTTNLASTVLARLHRLPTKPHDKHKCTRSQYSSHPTATFHQIYNLPSRCLTTGIVSLALAAKSEAAVAPLPIGKESSRANLLSTQLSGLVPSLVPKRNMVAPTLYVNSTIPQNNTY